jgi:cob(I)alamin adenosyltransferase
LPEFNSTGSVVIYTGDGKGKTSAAIGTAMRASGHEMKVLVIFFMKGPGYEHGEIKALKENPWINHQELRATGLGKKGLLERWR